MFAASANERPDKHGKSNETTHPTTVIEMRCRFKLIGFLSTST